MSQSLIVNGVSYAYPTTGDQQWGSAASAWALAVTNGMLQKAGGTFALTADVNFGASYGLLASYFSTRTSSRSTAGILRLAKLESIGWLNNAGSGNNLLTTDASDNLTYNGVALASSAGLVPVASGGTNISSYAIGNLIYASAATVLSKLAIGSANMVLTTNGTIPGWGLIVDANISALAAIAASKLVGTDIATVGTITTGTWSATAIALTKGGTGLTAAPTVNGTVLKAVSGAAAWAFPYSRVSKTTTYTLAVTDTHVDCDTSGAAFTVTIPAAAAGNTGQTAWIRKTTSDFNAVTLATGVSTTLNTNGECVQIQSDGSAWVIVLRYIPMDNVSYTPTYGAGLGTPTGVGFYYSRRGKYLHIQGRLTAGTVSAAAFSISLPSGLTIDSSLSASGEFVGTIGTSNNSAFYIPIALAAGGQTVIQAGIKGIASDSQLSGVNASQFIQTGNAVSISVDVPISGWNS